MIDTDSGNGEVLAAAVLISEGCKRMGLGPAIEDLEFKVKSNVGALEDVISFVQIQQLWDSIWDLDNESEVYESLQYLHRYQNRTVHSYVILHSKHSYDPENHIQNDQDWGLFPNSKCNMIQGFINNLYEMEIYSNFLETTLQMNHILMTDVITTNYTSSSRSRVCSGMEKSKRLIMVVVRDIIVVSNIPSISVTVTIGVIHMNCHWRKKICPKVYYFPCTVLVDSALPVETTSPSTITITKIWALLDDNYLWRSPSKDSGYLDCSTRDKFAVVCTD